MPRKKLGEPQSLFHRWCETPADDTLARVYADSLTERGDSLGEVIALAIDEGPTAPSVNPWLQMAQETARALEPRAEASPEPGAAIALTLPAEAWLSHRKALRERLPITALHLTVVEPEHLRALGRAGVLGPLRAVTLTFGSRNNGAPSDLATFLASTDLAALTELSVPIATPEAIDVVAAARHLHRLTTLRLHEAPGGIPLGTRALQALSLAHSLQALHTLELHFTRFEEAGLDALAQTPWPLQDVRLHGFADEPWLHWLSKPAWKQRLRALDVSTTCAALEKSTFPPAIDWPHLQTLTVREAHAVTSPGPHHDALLTDWWERLNAPALTQLRMHTQQAGPVFAAALTRQRFSEQLRSLTLSMRLDDATLSALAFGRWEALRKLHLEEGLLTEAGTRALSASNLPRALESLHLAASLDASAANALAKAEWKHLQTLEVNGEWETLISASAFPALKQLTGAPQRDVAEAYVRSPDSQLTELYLNGPTREALFALAGTPHTARLRKLTIAGGQQLDNAAAEALAASAHLHPHTLIIRNAHALTAQGKTTLLQRFRRGLVLQD